MTGGIKKPIRALWGFLLALALAGVSTAATVTITGVPGSAAPSQSLSVNVNFTKTGSDKEQRLVFILELRQVGSNATLAKWTLDNSNAGYKGASGTIPFSVTIPSNTTGQVYFAAWASPWSVNRATVARYKAYPTNGTFTYLWSGGGYGVTQNLYYLSTLVAPKPSGNTTYCSGLAFDAFITAWKDYNTSYSHTLIGPISTATQMEAFRKIWYGVTDAEKLAARAIPDYSVGVEITDWEEAQEGDFVQLWRHSGSGHNPLFVSWIRNGSGTITGVNYWGSQGSTNGIGYNSESFGVSSGIDPARFYLGRPRKPRDQADYDWALGTGNTSASPTSITASVGDWRDY
ncbi:MAG: hypothetical protein K1X53_05785 [Candidatus Sumerlaeaceae bacterium]|nr:hypothetical protein [Candidatus Sumerlaeaceae bacterium]